MMSSAGGVLRSCSRHPATDATDDTSRRTEGKSLDNPDMLPGMLIAHDLDGSGPTVVLLHSSVCDRRMWLSQADALLAAGYQVLRPDFRGFGDTPAPTETYDNAKDVLDLLDAHDIGQVAVVGASFGGRVAQELSARWPERVATLALICSARQGQPPTAAITAFGNREDELIEARDLDAAVALNVDTFVGPAADEATRELVAQMQRHAFEVQLDVKDVEAANVDYDIAAITARTLVVAGAHDVDYFHAIADHLAATIPGARLITLDWAGHLPSLEDPARFTPILLDFLTPPA
jgi:3-oxoadipate enol-lactonase